MERKCISLQCNNNRHLYVDEENAISILNWIEEDKQREKKFKYVSQLFLINKTTKDIFEKEDVNSDTKDVWAIKLKLSKNSRIYCKGYELEDGSFHLVMGEYLEHKDSQKLNHKCIALIKKVADYEYSI